MELRDIRQLRSLVYCVADQRGLFLTETPASREAFGTWVRSIEESHGVSIEFETVMGPDNRPSAAVGFIRNTAHTTWGMAFTVDSDETRCALRYR